MTKTLVSFLAAAALVSSEAHLALANSIAIDGNSVVYAKAPGAPWGGTQRVEGRLGMLVGGSDVGDANGFSMGVSEGLGYRVGDVTLRGLFGHLRVGDGNVEGQARRGRSTRIGGVMDRSSGELAVGFEFDARGDERRPGPRRHVG